MKRRRTRTRLQLVPETTGGRLVCGKELLFSWRCSHSRFTRETSSLPCFRYRILPSRPTGRERCSAVARPSWATASQESCAVARRGEESPALFARLRSPVAAARHPAPASAHLPVRNLGPNRHSPVPAAEHNPGHATLSPCLPRIAVEAHASPARNTKRNLRNGRVRRLIARYRHRR